MCYISHEAKANLKWWKEEISKLLFLKFESAYHARRWVDYERVLMNRTMLYMIGWFV